MPIHHAKVKKAANFGIVLTNDELEVCAHLTEFNIKVTLEAEDEEPATLNEAADNAMEAVLEIRDFQKETPSIRIRFEDGDYVAYRLTKAGRSVAVAEDEIARDPELFDLFETLREQVEEADDEDPEDRGSVVPEKYKKLYAERGDATHCGDWMALQLNSLCKVTNEKGRETTDLDRLEAIANANGVSPDRFGKLGIETNGWQGRFRMTTRNMLTKVVAATGVLFVPEGCGVEADTEMKAPREWCVAHSPKPKEAKAKTEKKTERAA